MRIPRTDLVLAGVFAATGLAASTESVLAAHSVAGEAGWGVVALAGITAGVAQTLRGSRQAARSEERVTELDATVSHLAKPEQERNIEMLATHHIAMQRADLLFRENFTYGGPSTETTVHCHHCGWQTTAILRDARFDALTHLNQAHALAA